ncbi:hypothetical protein BH20ACT2_BH20ACT2_12290 [soil metagenome]
MTETTEFEAITEAMALIDQGLGTMQHRALVSADEVSDLLLDVRTLLSHPLPEADDDTPVPVPN